MINDLHTLDTCIMKFINSIYIYMLSYKEDGLSFIGISTKVRLVNGDLKFEIYKNFSF